MCLPGPRESRVGRVVFEIEDDFSNPSLKYVPLCPSRLTSNKEKSNKDRKKVSLMVETDEDARTRRKKLLLAADGDHDMDGGGGAGGCTGDREQALLERNFFHNQVWMGFLHYCMSCIIVY